jgi:uncharacterized protein (TIGR01777 family)
LIAGGSGFIGRELSKQFSKDHELTLLSRSSKTKLENYHKLITWNDLTKESIKSYDVIINLCGYNIGEKRWSKSVKRKILLSRSEPTKKLAELIGESDIWLINASAIGYYNFSKVAQDEDDHIRVYDSLSFGQEVVDSWEKNVVYSKVKRFTILRFGVVIGNGGVLEKFVTSAKFGFITMFGDGDQYMSWISMNDLSRALKFIFDKKLDNKKVFNLTAPNACQHKVLARLLRKYLVKKYIIKMPEWFIKLMFGQMGKELLLSSQNIKPTKLISQGFTFEDIKMQKALERYLAN